VVFLFPRFSRIIFPCFSRLPGPARGLVRGGFLLALLAMLPAKKLTAGEPTGAIGDARAQTSAIAPAPAAGKLFINEYRISGAHKLARGKIEAAVYRFLGPGRTRDDVEGARAALETAYHDTGYQTVGVIIPEQEVKHGIVRLQVVERPVGRLRVRGAVYSSPAKLKAMAPSVAEGEVIDFNQVTPDIVALNQSPDRRVTPALHAGREPDTVDVDLEVKETAPVHGSMELNNRRGPDTTALRLNAALSANNLWQLGHGAGFSFQTSPQDTSEVKVYSGYYLARFAGAPGLTLMASGTKQDSNVSTLGDVAVAGRGDTAGLHAIFSLPSGQDFSHSVNVGIDYKHFLDKVHVGSVTTDIETPITYYPLQAAYSATWLGKKATTELNAAVNFNLRSTTGSAGEFGKSRYNADANYVYLHADLTQTRQLGGGYELVGKVQGQVADQPLINHEQASGGGVGTVRGYLEAEVVGDNAVFGSLEFRSPNLVKLLHEKDGDWRIYGFTEGGKLTINDPLPEQKDHFYLASVGVGTQLRLRDHFEGAFNASLPLYPQSKTPGNELRFSFRAAMDF